MAKWIENTHESGCMRNAGFFAVVYLDKTVENQLVLEMLETANCKILAEKPSSISEVRPRRTEFMIVLTWNPCLNHQTVEI